MQQQSRRKADDQVEKHSRLGVMQAGGGGQAAQGMM
jgi:hypothetical protein